MEASNQKRLFVAVALPEEAHEALEQLQNRLRRFARDAKWRRLPAST